MGGVPSVPTDRSRTVQVIGAGLSRTGTTSMAVALERLLDGPVMHTGTQLLGREDGEEAPFLPDSPYVRLCCDVLRHRHDRPVLLKLLREATAGFVAVTDFFAGLFVAELLELYPDAKVVLVTRDPERWARSAADIFRYIRMPCLGLILFPCPTWRWVTTWMDRGLEAQAERVGGDAVGPDFCRRHNQRVRDLVPPEKLLVMELSQGWAPLAEFLDRPVPAEPFPHLNDGPAMEASARHILGRAALTWLAIMCVVAAASWTAWRLGS